MKVSVEYAHVMLPDVGRGKDSELPAAVLADIERSTAATIAVRDHLVSRGHVVETVILIDDKRLDQDARQAAAAVTGAAELAGLHPDIVYFERDLIHVLDPLRELLPRATLKRLDRTVKHSLVAYESLPCSIDISLWHALRLGVLGPVDKRIPEYDLAISVLGDGLHGFEESAQRDVLRHLADERVAHGILPLYFPERPSANFHPQALVEQLELHLEEAARA
jgi:hypothetical protein